MLFRFAKSALMVGSAWMLLAGCSNTGKSAPIESRKRTGDEQAATPIVNKTAPVVAKSASAEKRVSTDPRPKTHTVQKGENLYRISLEYGLAYRDVAEWNNLDNINDIKVGQTLSLVPPANGVVTKPLIDAPVINKPITNSNIDSPKAIKLPYSEANKTVIAQASNSNAVSDKPVINKTTPAKDPVYTKEPEKTASTPVSTDGKSGNGTNTVDGLTWMWPTAGKVVGQFNESKQLKGLDISGKKGQPVVAAEDGKVVYSGSSLRGYGKFVIIKHESDYLSVYAHNDKLLVKEGAKVTRGQKIAEMGDSDSDQVKLHFEIRRYGKPVDPAKMLPNK
ncbi:peptidoglycan DD-metalloendopeptidase family protein [Leeia sp. TBRC 13508]|uniref:Peptidoglycan DD-metalloendopeptidase family protein n=1 Tax=Leeia speluncae TaxID=2884804 RepID=A0ABS8D7Y1_9NEIS|nr:peptidoglycan DD-metalloendopeptidase family protein [Leeia speluncae]MCB6184321.1 peptidoglycan DD-metalloendopeptidase family protein [Leeia speluncae]